MHSRTTGAITRRHFFVEHEHTAVPIFSIVGGKLTTMRSLAEQAAADVLKHFERTPGANSRERPFPGAEGYPANPAGVDAALHDIAARTGFSVDSVRETWVLLGTRAEGVLAAATDRQTLPDSNVPEAFVRWSIAEEHVHGLADLVERRVMLLYHEHLSRACLRRLAELLAEQNRLPASEVDTATEREVARLLSRFGKSVV